MRISIPNLNLTEKQFESDIEYSLLTYGGYEKCDPKAFDRVAALDTTTLISSVKRRSRNRGRNTKPYMGQAVKNHSLNAFAKR